MMTQNFLLLSATWLFLVGFSSCSLSETAAPAEENQNIKKSRKRKVTDVGKVASVNAEEQFVLIKLMYAQSGEKHSLLYVEQGDRRATLTPTGEKIGSFLAADITKGKVVAGDQVIALTLNNEEESNPLTPLTKPAPKSELLETEVPAAEAAEEALVPEETTAEKPPASLSN